MIREKVLTEKILNMFTQMPNVFIVNLHLYDRQESNKCLSSVMFLQPQDFMQHFVSWKASLPTNINNRVVHSLVL